MALRRGAPPGTPWVNQAGELLHLADGVAVGGSWLRFWPVAMMVAAGAGFGGASSDLVHEHLEVVADHAVAVLSVGRRRCRRRWLLGRGVLRDLAEDPGVGGRGAADHDGVAAGGVDHGGGVFGRADVAVADDRNVDGVLDGGDVLPAGLAGVAVLAGAGVQGARR